MSTMQRAINALEMQEDLEEEEEELPEQHAPLLQIAHN
jgi:hypothetical protein